VERVKFYVLHQPKLDRVNTMDYILQSKRGKLFIFYTEFGSKEGQEQRESWAVNKLEFSNLFVKCLPKLG
jgi:hypothetical protein